VVSDEEAGADMLGEYPISRIFNQLAADNLLPAILFRTARKQCDADILRVSRSRGALLSVREQQALKAEIDRLIEQYQVERQVILGHPQYPALIETGVGAHHAGQLLIWRLLLEELMSRGLLRIMIATGTVAAGVDFPARTVVITAHSKRGAEGFATLSSSEFQQMSGRAGRRGKDAVGICLVAPGPFSDARVISEVAKKPAEPLRSAYFAAPSTVLNLLKFRSVDDLRYTVEKSLAAFLDRKAARRLHQEAINDEAQIQVDQSLGGEGRKKALKRVRRKMKEAEEVEKRQSISLTQTLEGLDKLGYLEAGGLSEKGLWAAHLCTSLVLELGEALSDFLFAEVTLEELVGLIASIAGDPHRHYLSIRQNPIKAELFARFKESVQRVRQSYQSPYSTEIEVVPDAAVTVTTWMEAQSWSEYAGLLHLAGVADGDAARLIMQTAEHLGQLSRLYESHPDVARLAAEGKRKLLKPPLSESVLDD
jgi:ATP-dependent RNA helicase HelY